MSADALGEIVPKDGARLKELQASADAAAAHVRSVFFFFLTYGLYLAVTVGATTHEQLLRSAPVQLPILNVDIPLFGFYWIAPALFVLLHFNLMLQFYLLARKLREFEESLAPLPQAERTEYLTGLNSLAFSHMLIGRHHSWLFRILFRLIVWITVIILPVILLLGVQVRFLPYHDPWTTTAHRFFVLLDLLLLLIIWPQVVDAPEPKLAAQHLRNRLRSVRDTSFPALAALVGLSSLFLFTFPGDDPSDPETGDPMEEVLLGWFRPDGWFATWRDSFVDEDARPPTFRPTAYLFDGSDFLNRNLKVPETNLVTAWPSKDQIEQFDEDKAWQNFGGAIVLQGRDLRYSDFRDSTLVHADLRTANLRGASLWDANLQGASLAGANLRGADLWGANLQNALLVGSSLQGVHFCMFGRCPDLQGADLSGTNLQGITLRTADLRGASLRSANLQGADLAYANLQGAFLFGTGLQGASLRRANLQGARLRDAKIQGTDLTYADLEGAVLETANLQNADLTYANLRGTNLDGANLQGASLEGANLQGGDLRRARLWQSTLDQEAEQYLLSDLRYLDLNPPSAQDIDRWIETAKSEITHEEAQARVLGQLEELRHYLGSDWAPAFPPELAGRSDVLLDIGPPPAFTEFDRKLANFLIKLACDDNPPPSVATAIGWRAFASSEEGDRRLYPALLAEALLDTDRCPPAKELPERLLAFLKERRAANEQSEPEAAPVPIRVPGISASPTGHAPPNGLRPAAGP